MMNKADLTLLFMVGIKVVCSVFVLIVSLFLECLRKRARGHVTVRAPGTGIVTINGQDITYFDVVQSREQVKLLIFNTS